MENDVFYAYWDLHSIAPIVGKKNLGFVLAQDERIGGVTSHDVDVVCLDETQLSAGEPQDHLLQHGLGWFARQPNT